MSTVRNFRITVNLSNFFHDHRNRARIFINDDIQTISDLEERIEKIFNIQNFHLTSQNEYLPPSEDARILQKDDIVWVIPNGGIYDSIGTSSASNKNVNKPKRSEEKDSTSILSEGYVNEELKPVKKKKKKYDIEESEENVSSPINYEPKKKKKKKEKPGDVSHSESVNDINMEFNSSLQQKGKNKSRANISNTGSSVDSPDELNSSKKNFMNINTLLPVLQSHINTYNKKISTSQLNKPSTSTKSLSPKKKFHSDEEKSSYICKGNLPLYKKKTQVPTTTEEYLNEKRVNIVKIEYIKDGTTKTVTNTEIKNKETSENAISEVCNVPIVDADHTRANNTASDFIISRILGYTDNNSPAEGITPLKTPNSCKAVNVDSSLIIVNRDTKNSDQYMGDSNLLEYSHEVVYDEQVSKREEQMDTEKDGVDQINGGTQEEQLCPAENMETTEIIPEVYQEIETLKRPAVPLGQKYFFSKEFPENNTRVVDSGEINSVSQNNSIPTSMGNVYNTETCDKRTNDDPQLKETNTEVIPSDLEDRNVSDPTPESNYSEFLRPDSRKTTDNLDFPHANHTDLDMRPSYNPTENSTSPNSALDKTSPDDDSPPVKSYFEHFLVDMGNKSENSEVFAMDLTAPSVRKENGPQTSATQPKDMSRYSRMKQESGVGQLLEDLRSNDSVVSLESVESDSSEFVTKRQRKRVRKRKKKNVNSSPNNTSVDLLTVESPVQLKALNLKSGPAKHIIFEEGNEGEELKAIDITKHANPKAVDDSYVECVSIRSDLEESKIEIPNIKIEDILKSPSMNKMLPKVADLIAFKVLRISETYTPEISNFIVGKVLDFDTTNKHILFEILSGIEQCQDQNTYLAPGKCHVEMDGCQVEQTFDNRREFMWIDLVDPRLLYP